MTCINLKERFGDRFKVVYEESYYADRGENARAEDPWYMILLCQNGHISPWDDKRLAACTSRPGSVAKRLKALPFAETVQDGDDGANVAFPVEHFAEVAEIMRPRKRKRLSEEQRQQATERPRKYQPAKGQRVQDLVRQAANSDQTSVPEVALV
jgi:hypothetical protein